MSVAGVKFRRLSEEREANGDLKVDPDATTGDSGSEVVLDLEKEKHVDSSMVKSKKRCKVIFSSWKAVLIGVAAFAVAIGISLLIYKLVREPRPPFHPGGVAADAPVCSDLAGGILEQGGSGVDAAITAMLCVGLVHPESSGIGGGGFMIIFDPSTSRSTAISFREKAPAAASKDMFHGNRTLALRGGLSVGIPGEISGMEQAHKRFGKLNWSELFQPVIELAQDGFNLTTHGANAIKAVSLDPLINDHPLFRAAYYNSNGQLKKKGDLVKRPEFAKVLSDIARLGARAFYTGAIADEIVSAVSSTGGILTKEDLGSYEADVEIPLNVSIMDTLLHTLQVPSGGPDLAFPLNVMDVFLRGKDLEERRGNATYQFLVESFKYMFAERSYLGDPACDLCRNITEAVLAVQANMTSESFADLINSSISLIRTFNVSHYNPSYDTPNDSGTTHISAVDANGLAVSVTSSVNTYFGSLVMTERGIVLNNDMDDFSSPNITNTYGLPPFTANFIRPGKRGLSSTCPSIFTKTDDNGRQYAHLIIGGAGGTMIPTAVAQAALAVLAMDEDIGTAIEARRMHHQLTPNILLLEKDYPAAIASYLRSIGHVIALNPSFAVVQGIVRQANGNTTAHSDSRKNKEPGHAFLLPDNN